MKSYPELTFHGKLRRLHNLAVQALAHYDLDTPQLSYHGFFTNLLYRVASASGEHFMLRLAAPGWRTLVDLQSEAMWLGALHCDTSISVPIVIPSRDGEDVLSLSAPDIFGVWNATIMTWVPGSLLGHYLTRRNLEKMGALVARLHLHAAAWVPPTGFTTRRFEHWLSRGEDNRLIDDTRSSAVKGTPPGRIELPSRMRLDLERMNNLVENAYAALDRADLRVIHCDLWHDNIKLHQGVLHPFDFEDTIWGFRAHDIAMAMLDLLDTVGDEAYPDLFAAFKRGYQAYLAWPADPIEPFQIGRLLWKINWVASHEPAWLISMIERHIPVFTHYEQTGIVVKPRGD